MPHDIVRNSKMGSLCAAWRTISSISLTHLTFTFTIFLPHNLSEKEKREKERERENVVYDYVMKVSARQLFRGLGTNSGGRRGAQIVRGRG